MKIASQYREQARWVYYGAVFEAKVEIPGKLQRPVNPKTVSLVKMPRAFLWFIRRCGHFSILVCATALYGQINYDSAHLERQLKAVRTRGKIVLDGRLDEPDWTQSPIAADFIQNNPRTDDPASEKTEVRVLYDKDNLYFGVYAHQTSQITVSDLRKDFTINTGDFFQIVLDSFLDRRNGYLFATNPTGAKYDTQMANEGRETNVNWDAVWNVKTRIAEDGWIAEISIPFKTLKFRAKDTQSWGINFQRTIRRKNEDSFWSPLPYIYALDRVSLAGTMSDLERVKPGLNLRVKPYMVTNLSQPRAGRNLLPGEKKQIPFCRWASGGNCYNADFGVDVKYGLTTGLTWDFTYNTDFSQVEADEQQVNLTRFNLFFPEKREFFLENSGIFTFGAEMDRPITGGRIGTLNNNMVMFFSRNIGLSSTGSPIPILGGTRLTGRVGSYELGLLNIQQKEFDTTHATNFTVARLRRNILSNSDIGVMLVNKEVSGSPHYNRVFGGDANFRFGQTLSLNGYLAKSFTDGIHGDDLAARVSNIYKTNKWEWRNSYMTVQNNFVDEMGFVPRVGIHKVSGVIYRTFRPKRLQRFLRQSNPHLQWDYVMDSRGNLMIRHVDYHVPFSFQNGASSEMGTNPTLERFDKPFVINRVKNIAIPPGIYSFTDYFVSFSSDNSRAISGNANFHTGRFYTGYKQSYTAGGTLRFGAKLSTSVSFIRNNVNLPQGHFLTDLITTRFDYSFSTKMFLNALLQYNTDTHQVSSNIRFNLIHRPLSDIFVVYNEHRSSLGNDLVDRTLAIKFTYMISR